MHLPSYSSPQVKWTPIWGWWGEETWILALWGFRFQNSKRKWGLIEHFDVSKLAHRTLPCASVWSAFNISGASPVAQTVKRLPAMRETHVQSLGREDPLEKEMATHSSILAWRTPWIEEAGRLQSTEPQRVGHNWETSLHFNISAGEALYLPAASLRVIQISS